MYSFVETLRYCCATFSFIDYPDAATTATTATAATATATTAATAPRILWLPAQHTLFTFALSCIYPFRSLCWFLCSPGLSDSDPSPPSFCLLRCCQFCHILIVWISLWLSPSWEFDSMYHFRSNWFVNSVLFYLCNTFGHPVRVCPSFPCAVCSLLALSSCTSTSLLFRSIFSQMLSNLFFAVPGMLIDANM